ncbi:hypothetical protein ACNKHL_05805 [Shigella flexneri]
MPAYLSAKRMSLHRRRLSRSVGAGGYPRTSATHIALVGLQPAMLDDYGGSQATGTGATAAAEQAALAQLAAWGMCRNRLMNRAVSIMTVCRWKITKAFACASTG